LIDLSFDVTGVGVAVADLLRSQRWPNRCHLTGISIHGGDVSRAANGKSYVPKRDLVSSLVVLFQSGELKIAAGLADQDVLLSELLNFRGRLSNSGHDTYGNSAEVKNDDMVSACAFAAYRASLGRVGPSGGRLYW
jgi:hypothetical protein